jgi:hypothetical protein
VLSPLSEDSTPVLGFTNETSAQLVYEKRRGGAGDVAIEVDSNQARRPALTSCVLFSLSSLKLRFSVLLLF